MSSLPSNPEPESSIDINSTSWVDLRQYSQAGFDRGRPAWYIVLWWLIQGVVFPLTLHNAHGIRVRLLRWFGAQIGDGVVIRPSARFTYPWKVEIGDYSWIGEDVVFYSLETIKIGRHCVISQKSYLCTGSHNIEDSSFPLVTSPICMGNGVWVATDCFVAPGVEIGSNTVVGARSSVFRSLPAAYICWGTPAKPRTPRIFDRT
ncbi:hormogonium polysaccharide biosynthesis acetyltransferase HpsU [Roseofilum casamattae]|uniref:Hormogonium polysaccharide biosynthesis acetyltransferase HpsU n=1 Tax=Roseofilum casamattae BLCC-M143 TaxID=3022442 RepID=A0ABT7BS28_9CYAN|nr:hormogonium polysaccharide biosynthesis acetyltransferase HpsU [Roseofilum casamattae]MDJ1181997.1 hormogonium polysaccharide biosynthesis acetyltransferase HpsU [Roseofilum casamattae BLCC-M143]